ncbi:MAG TPA: hypothetical protein VH369_03920 [Bryobacteraceae bacterium]
MRIVDVRAYTVTVPLEAALRHANGCHWGRAVRLRQYQELYKELGNYPYDQDPLRPGWAPIIPNDRWADPKDDRRPPLRGVK